MLHIKGIKLEGWCMSTWRIRLSPYNNTVLSKQETTGNKNNCLDEVTRYLLKSRLFIRRSYIIFTNITSHTVDRFWITNVFFLSLVHRAFQ